MPIVRRLVAHDENYDNQWLKVDHTTRYIENDSEDWQFLFGPNSILSVSTPIVKIWAKLNTGTLNNIQVIGYLYDSVNAGVFNAASCSFNFYKVSLPDWTEEFITTLSGSQLANNYYYVNPDMQVTFPTVNFDGEDTIMIEATLVRLGTTYRERVYVNHLGVYSSILQLRNDVQFLSVTKEDL